MLIKLLLLAFWVWFHDRCIVNEGVVLYLCHSAAGKGEIQGESIHGDGCGESLPPQGGSALG